SVSALAADPPAEVIYQHGKVYTVDQAGTVAQALVIRAGRIVYVGTDEGAQPYVGKTTSVVELGGRTVMPGLVDGHMHPVAAGMDLLKCNLSYASLTVEQFRTRLRSCLDERRKSEGPDSWLEVVNWFRYGMGAQAAGVDRTVLDSLKTQRPIIVHDSFGHSSLVNSRALALAKITAQTRDPVGGRIDRDASGQPTGILEDAAQESIAALLPKPTAADHVAGARAALNALRQQGITTFLDAVGSNQDIEAFAAVEREGALTARAHFAPLIRPADAPNVDAARQAVAKIVATAKKYDEGAIRPTPSISVHQAKLFMDGVINAPANTGALLEPYLVNRGTAQSPKFEPAVRREPDVYFPVPILTEILIGLGRNDIDPHLHTDGDWAVRAGLDGVQAMRAALPGRDVRPGFAHCELVDPTDYPRFAQLNVTSVLSFQWEKPASDTVDGVRDSLGARRWPLIEPAGWLAQKGARIAYGSDWPVDPLDEWFALQVGVTRRDRPDAPPKYSGRLGKDPGLSQAAVIQAVTFNAAYELHEERYIGSLEAGKLADFIVLDRDVASIPSDQIAGTKVLRTIVGGRVVYDNGQLKH
ncbi:MAG TPA: amidohydrolase, partial [Steroidobacteraceae bacterium]